MKRRLFTTALALALCLGLAVPAAAAAFYDVPEAHWAYSYIEQASARGFVQGDGKGYYNPGGSVTYADFATMLVRGFFSRQLDAYSGAKEPWYAPYCAVASEQGLFQNTRYQKGEAGADSRLTRTEMAFILQNTLTCFGMEPLSASVKADLREVIPDIDLYTEEEQEAILAVYSAAVLTGVNLSGTFAGSNEMSRAEAATVMLRLDSRRDNWDSPDSAQKPLLVNGQPITEYNVLVAISALRTTYPEGTSWTEENSYYSIGLRTNGYGSAGFALLCSDAAFGTLPATRTHAVFEDIKVGDILRMDGDACSAVVLEKRAGSVVVVEGNLDGCVHWGREISRGSLEEGTYYVQTRYPA